MSRFLINYYGLAFVTGCLLSCFAFMKMEVARQVIDCADIEILGLNFYYGPSEFRHFIKSLQTKLVDEAYDNFLYWDLLFVLGYTTVFLASTCYSIAKLTVRSVLFLGVFLPIATCLFDVTENLIHLAANSNFEALPSLSIHIVGFITLAKLTGFCGSCALAILLSPTVRAFYKQSA